MTVAAAYFENHQRGRRFPWSIYHGRLEDDLSAFLRSICQDSSRSTPEVLVVGCGLLTELDRAPDNIRLTAVDVDPRAVEVARTRSDRRLCASHVLAPGQALSELGRFDAVYAKEVIEHISEYGAWLQDVLAALKPGGRVWLSTPNYGEPWLPAVEYTFLELVARMGGYTRFGMHPAKFSARRLRQALAAAGFAAVRVRAQSFRLALVAEARSAS
jgi:2-polyprenyl-3-methyl-5-hydroxy-6-metoxy-1,4-benzoquinol methylase